MTRQVIWRSTDAPKQERYIVRIVYTEGSAIEYSFKKPRPAQKKADEFAALGHYVEIIDQEGWYWG